MKTNVLILEDEDYTQRFLKFIVSTCDKVAEVFVTSDPNKALENVEWADIVLVDIELTEDVIDGLETAKLIAKAKPEIEFIFITAYSQYSLKAYYVHPYDYLIKPINEARLLESLNKLAERLEKLKIPIANETRESNQLIIKEYSDLININPDNIIFIEKIKNEDRVTIYLEDKEYHVSKKLGELENMLDNRFKRSHRSYIINIEKIEKISRISMYYEVSFQGIDKKALISGRKYNKIKKELCS